jgi:branched-chain amino acid transport system substrate-binding protein
MVPLLASLLATAACGSRLETAELQTANGVLTTPSGVPGPAAAAPGPEAAAAEVADSGTGATVPAPQVTPGPASAGSSVSAPKAAAISPTAAARPASAAASSGGPAGQGRGVGLPSPAAGENRERAAAPVGDGGAARPQGAAPLPDGAPAGPKPEILLGSFGAASGILGAVTGTIPAAIRAWSASVNARGGIAGHPVRVILADDGGDPARTQAIVRQMVEQSHVVAFFSHYSFTVTGVEKYLESKGVPLIGGTGGDFIEDHSSMIFEPLLGADHGGAWAFLLAVAAQTDKKKLAVLYCREVSQCANLIGKMKSKLPYADLDIVYESQISLAQPDFTGEMIQAQRAGAEVVIVMVDAATLGRLAQSAHRQNYRPIFAGPWNLDIDSTIASAGKVLDGSFIGPGRSAMYQTSPKLADYREAMARYQPDEPRGGLGAAVFIFGRLLEKVVAALPGPVTSEGIVQGLLALRGETLGGLLPGITFPPGNDRTQVNQCVVPYTLRGGKFVAHDAAESFFCAPGWSPAS